MNINPAHKNEDQKDKKVDKPTVPKLKLERGNVACARAVNTVIRINIPING